MDLIEIPLSDEESGELRAAISSYAYRIGTKHDKKFSVRRTDYGIGIWRTK